MVKKNIHIVLLLLMAVGYTQDKTTKVDTLTVVELSDYRLRFSKDKQLTVKIADSIIKLNSGSLTDVLRQQSTIYFKENGLAMVSSPSFRGTNASQTAVVWNGININSQLNGQVDFNAISLIDANSISVKSGGGSVFYGSGAIGGSVHLNHEFNFNKSQDYFIGSSYGSFDTYDLRVKANYSTKKHSLGVNTQQRSSKNDYEFYDSDKINENAAFKNGNVGLNYGVKLGKKDVLKTFFTYFQSKRELSGTLVALSNDRLDDISTKSMVSWSHKENNWETDIKLAHLYEAYTYYDNKEKLNLGTGSKAGSVVANLDAVYKISNKIKLFSGFDGRWVKGNGENIGDRFTRVFAPSLLVKHKIFNWLDYQVTVRKEFSNVFESPLIYQGSISISPLKWYKFAVDYSKNFRAPTFNDLFWNGLGNLNLVPENSEQYSFNSFVKYKFIDIGVSIFAVNITDMIKWTPDDSGKWTPQNIAKVKSEGVEAVLKLRYEYRKHKFLLSSIYNYTETKDLKEDKFLIYVPKHQFRNNLTYAYKKVVLNIESSYVGRVFTSINNVKELPFYNIVNTRVNIGVLKNENLELALGLKWNNVFNTKYVIVESRPMPLNNYLINLNLNF